MHRESVLRSDEPKLLKYAYKVNSNKTLAAVDTLRCYPYTSLRTQNRAGRSPGKGLTR
jgi:hypothetical protein